jgi:hypothetical protein
MIIPPDELTALAAELRAGNPALSDEQALDAAAVLFAELSDEADLWDIDRDDGWLELAAYARAWDETATLIVTR